MDYQKQLDDARALVFSKYSFDEYFENEATKLAEFAEIMPESGGDASDVVLAVASYQIGYGHGESNALAIAEAKTKTPFDWMRANESKPVDKNAVYDIVMEVNGESARIVDVMYDEGRDCFRYYDHENAKIEAPYMYVTHYRLAEILPNS